MNISIERNRLTSLLVHLYNSGYIAGHHDTVEGGYIDILSCDLDTEHVEEVFDLIGEIAPDLFTNTFL
jgi:hypothetical protein